MQCVYIGLQKAWSCSGNSLTLRALARCNPLGHCPSCYMGTGLDLPRWFDEERPSSELEADGLSRNKTPSAQTGSSALDFKHCKTYQTVGNPRPERRKSSKEL